MQQAGFHANSNGVIYFTTFTSYAFKGHINLTMSGVSLAIFYYERPKDYQGPEPRREE